MINLYHGSIYSFEEIDISKGKGFKDFGKGFYATADPAHADRLALRNKSIEERRQQVMKDNNLGKKEVVVAYRYNLLFSEETSNLKIKVFEKADKEWLRFILENRKNSGCAHDFDIVIGPTADAQTTKVISDYLVDLEDSCYSDEICDKVISELMPDNLPKQYFFRTEKAIKTLTFDKVKRQVVG